MKRKRIIPIVSVLILLVLWELLALFVGKPELIPTTGGLLKALGGLMISSTFYLSVMATLLRGLVGIGLSLLAAIGFAFVFSRIKWVYELFHPILTIMRSVPVISFILLALIFLHTESIPLIIGFLTMFPLLTENLTKGICAIQPGLSIMADKFRIERYNRFMQIIYPQLKPFLYSGLISAAGFGWRAIIMGEVLSQCRFGVGSEMKRAQSFIEVPELIAWTIVAVFISYVSDKLITALSLHRQKISFRKDSINGTGSGSLNKLDLPAPIYVEDISYKYGISDFSYVFDSGKIYGISAPSGAGKTTLLNLLNGTYQPVKGKIKIDYSDGISSVFQTPELLSHLTVLENIVFPLARIYSYHDAQLLAEPVLIALEMKSYENSLPGELSYGQQQRIAIARALLYPSRYLFMDEPFKGLDKLLVYKIIDYIREQQSLYSRAILFTTHDQDELKRFANEIVYL